MISDRDRSGYIGASDVQYVIGNWKTKTWEKWWLQKLGISPDHFDNRYTIAGTNWEHKVLDSLGLPDMEKDRQVIIEDLRLRINLDGNTSDRIKEVKTYIYEKGYKPPEKHRNQVQVQMFGSGIFGADIVSYGLMQEDYDNFLRPIDPDRRKEHPAEYSPQWVETVYLPKHLILCECLKKGIFPDV